MALQKMRKKPVLAVLLPLMLTACAGGSGDWFSFLRPAKVTWNDTKWCVPLPLQFALYKVARKFGPVTVYSTHRWPLENKRKGGKPKSFHLSCRAVDFAVQGNPSQVTKYLISLYEVGGYSYYKQGFYHIDNGPRRTW